MFDYDESFIVDKLNDREEDFPIDCPACDGKGRFIDFWGPMTCASCDGVGIILYRKWMAYIKSFSPDIQQYVLRTEPLRWRKLNGR